MRWGLVGACALAVAPRIARAHPHDPHPEHVSAHLSCTSDGKRVTDGSRRALDHDVTCEIIVDDLEADLDGSIGASEVSVESAQPFGAVAQGAALPAPATFAVGTDFPRCADTTFRGVLHRRSDIAWTGSLTVRAACPTVRVRAKLTCAPTPPRAAGSGSGSDADQIRDLIVDAQPSVTCAIAIGHAPDAPLRAWFESDLSIDAPVAVDVDPAAGAGTAATADLTSNADVGREMRCQPRYARAALVTADGAIAWTAKIVIQRCPAR